MSMATNTARRWLLLARLRVATFAKLWPGIGENADTEGLPAAGTLATLLEYEIAERANRRTARNLAEARLPSDKTVDTFDFAAVPMASRAHTPHSPKATAGSTPAPTYSVVDTRPSTLNVRKWAAS